MSCSDGADAEARCGHGVAGARRPERRGRRNEHHAEDDVLRLARRLRARLRLARRLRARIRLPVVLPARLLRLSPVLSVLRIRLRLQSAVLPPRLLRRILPALLSAGL